MTRRHAIPPSRWGENQPPRPFEGYQQLSRDEMEALRLRGVGRSPAEFWEWFDALPKQYRDWLNNPDLGLEAWVETYRAIIARLHEDRQRGT